MKKLTILFFITIFCFFHGISQDNLEQLFEKNGEIYFQFDIESKKDISELTKIISIDNVRGNTVFAYANLKEFKSFLKLGLDYTLLPHPNEGFKPVMATFEQIKNMDAWDVYPTYEAYVAMMYQFATDYPAICTVYSIGQSVNARELLVARISDNVYTDEDEPEFFYTSTMHGDETAGYIFMLRLIDSLLTSYGSAPRITNLVDNIEIYINPLANPDGTYAAGNNTVSGATRNNANGENLNRNFPDPVTGLNPNTQPETYAFMAFEENRHLVMSCNIHGGVEVCNYPWDRWTDLTADDNWWQYVCRDYADTAQAYSPAGYMTYQNNGITNGADWYIIYGGRQDYMNYFQQCREFTLELSNQKLLSASSLPAYWGYNRRSLLNYMEQILFGIRGVITDSITGQPIEAEVYILNHEADSSWVYSDLPVGNYHRPVYEGTYDIQFSAGGYITKVIENVNVTNNNTALLDVQLVPVTFFQVSIKVLLEGPFNGNYMNTNLIGLTILPLNQPYNTFPWNYDGTESVGDIPNSDIVDWILVELRDAENATSATSGTVVAQQAAFLKKNGSVVGLDGASILSFNHSIIQSLFVVIWHRNHLGIMTALPLTETDGIYSYDFSTGSDQAYGTESQTNLGSGIYGMFAGDANADGIINDNDGTESWYLETGQSGYLGSDVNLNGQSNNQDKNDYWYINYGKISQVPD